MTISKALDTYLKDHLAGSRGGFSLAKRIASGSEDAGERREVEAIAAEIKSEREELAALMRTLGVTPSRFKIVGAWAGEKLTALKLNSSRGDRRLLELEGMIMGVTGKLELWRALQLLADREPRLVPVRLAELERQAEDQRLRLERLHGQAAESVLSGTHA